MGNGKQEWKWKWIWNCIYYLDCDMFSSFVLLLTLLLYYYYMISPQKLSF
jgi:hypothetical protein